MEREEEEDPRPGMNQRALGVGVTGLGVGQGCLQDSQAAGSTPEIGKAPQLRGGAG